MQQMQMIAVVFMGVGLSHFACSAKCFRQVGAMTPELIHQSATALPLASFEQPFGPGTDVWKIGGKIFAAMGGEPAGLTVKCTDIDTARLLIEVGKAVKAPYFHASWVRFPLADTDEAEAIERLLTSYRLVRGNLPKWQREKLDADQGT